MIDKIPGNEMAKRVLAISTYELGHQPVVLAQLADTLRSLGVTYTLCDNSVSNKTFEEVDDFRLHNGELPTHILISVPMHTATQLGRAIADRAKTLLQESVKIAAVGLYANVALAASKSFDFRMSTATESRMRDFLGLDHVDRRNSESASEVLDRRDLPGLSNYAYLLSDGEKKLVGYVETTIGCAHTCRHCPVPVTFEGKFRAVKASAVLEQIDQLYEEGARHINFGDPDFLNGPAHALRIVRSMHASHPDLTFDATVKVQHVLEHPQIWEELRESGLSFVVSAFEHTSDRILSVLGKGHTRSDMIKALTILRKCDIEVRPSLMPFTPWTDRESLLDLVEFIFDLDLVASIDPIQLAIRMLIPIDSLVISETDVRIGPWNSELLSFEWHNADPELDRLQIELARIAEAAQGQECDPVRTFNTMRDAIYRRFDMQAPVRESCSSTCESRPRLSESWYCCAEPTKVQLTRLG